MILIFFQPYLFLCITMVSAMAIQIKGQQCALIKVLWSGFMLVKQENPNKFLWDLWAVVDQSPVIHLLNKGKKVS